VIKVMFLACCAPAWVLKAMAKATADKVKWRRKGLKRNEVKVVSVWWC
jgi:hypothetical protein